MILNSTTAELEQRVAVDADGEPHHPGGPSDSEVCDIAWSSGLVAAGSADGHVVLWNLNSGVLLDRYWSNRRAVTAVRICDQGEHVVSGGKDGTLSFYSIAEKKGNHNIRYGHDEVCIRNCLLSI